MSAGLPDFLGGAFSGGVLGIRQSPGSVSIFYDTGQVAARRQDLTDDLRKDYGIGFRFGTDQGVFIRVDVAFGSGEGIRPFVAFSHVDPLSRKVPYGGRAYASISKFSGLPFALGLNGSFEVGRLHARRSGVGRLPTN